MRNFFLMALVLSASLHAQCCAEEQKKIGVCIAATGSADQDVKSLIESGRKFFCPSHAVTYIVFTDSKQLETGSDVIQIHQAKLGWPYDSLKRFHFYDAHHDLLEKFDYIFSIDPNMVFVSPVGDEVLSDLISVQHPVFVGKRGAYENKRFSTAFVRADEGKEYFTSRIYGGTQTEFFKLVKVMKKQIDADLARNYIAKWHDESYLNRYLIDHPPSRILDPAYCCSDDWNMKQPKKIVVSQK